MKTSISLDKELGAQIKKTAALTRERPATVVRMAIRAGLPIVANRFQEPRPEGYFADCYKKWPKERLELEEAMAQVPTGPDR
ncbi:MAG: hypothetical protein C5B50_02525 [Verrucomicrobia bacterium]|nr:MAG: hypothetical protein C5B50_02525 [Verrucomicrobiota bacterium]